MTNKNFEPIAIAIGFFFIRKLISTTYEFTVTWIKKNCYNGMQRENNNSEY